MKRGIAKGLALLFVLLAGCQPTPEQEFVVNKGDGSAEQKLAAIAEPAAKSDIPDRWVEEAEQMNARVSVSFDADIVQKADGAYPLYRTRTVDIPPEEITGWLELLLPPPTAATTLRMTRADWTQLFQEYMDHVAELQAWAAAGKPDRQDRDETIPTQEEIDERSAFFWDQINSAPEENEATAVSDYRNLPGSERRYSLSDGNVAFVLADEEEVIVGKGCHFFPYNYYDFYYHRDKLDGGTAFVPLWQEVTMTREEAEAVLNKELERLGFSDFSVVNAYPSNLMEDDENTGYVGFVTTGWAFLLRRNLGGYPFVDVPYRPSSQLRYDTGDGYAVSPWIQEERLEVLVNEDGVQSFYFGWKRDVVGIENMNVALLPFEEMILRIKNALAMCYPKQAALHVYRLQLTTQTLRVKNSEDYYEMPCWIVFFRDTNSSATEEDADEWRDVVRETLVINAVDGSIIHTG